MCSSILWLAISLAGQARFERHAIDTFPAGYQAAVADVDRDGKLDVLALSTRMNRVVWYKNPNWQQYPIASTPQNIDLAPLDFDRDGRMELALATGFYFDDASRGGEIYLLRQPADLKEPWPKLHLATDPVVHRLRWGDLDGDGRPELVHAPIFGPGSQGAKAPRPAHLWAFEFPPGFPNRDVRTWSIDETFTVLHGLWVGNLDDDPRDEILTASFEGIHRLDGEPQDGRRWTKRRISPGAAPASREPGAPRGSSEAVPMRLPAGRLAIAAIEPWHGNQVALYTPGAAADTWQRVLLDDSLKEGHALVVANLDRDEEEEILAGWRGGEGGLKLYDAHGGQYPPQLLDHGIAVESLVAADINGDGKLDIVAVGGRTNQIVWYENKSP